MKKYKVILLVAILILLLGIGYIVNSRLKTKSSKENINNIISPSPSLQISPSKTNLNTESPAATPLPESYLIEGFSFQSQAPLANWDELHDEACEEASLALVQYYYDQDQMSAQDMEDEIQEMVDWEIENFGFHKDLTIEETAQMAKDFYGLTNWKIEKNIDIDTIKREIFQNHPIIIPTAGRLLGNPNFRTPGPIYHMVVAIGYNSNRIIVQDVGTRNGNHYEYNEKIFLNAIHDWNGSPENIENGSKNILVFY